MRSIAASIALLGAMLASSHALDLAQGARTSTQVVRGHVVAADTGQPLRNARVSTTASDSPGQVVLTDADGHFAVAGVVGATRITVSKSGYAPSDFAITSQTLDIVLPRGGVISGRVTDEFGEPVIAARVSAERRSASSSTSSTIMTTESDDRGEYRLGGLATGPYVVGVLSMGPAQAVESTGNGGVIWSAARYRIYFPGVPTPERAEAVTAILGEEQSGIDLTVPSAYASGPFVPVQTVTAGNALRGQRASAVGTGIIRGRVSTTDGRALPNTAVVLFEQRAASGSRTVKTDTDGRFEFGDLPAGSFRVLAEKAGYTPQSDLVSAPLYQLQGGIVVELADGQIRERVALVMARWGTMTGVVQDEYGDPLQGASVQLLHVRYENGRRRLVGVGRTSLTDDLGRFRLYAIAPGQYIVSAAVGAVTSNDVPGYTRAYFPQTSNPGDAQFVTVAVSQDLTGFDLTLTRTQTARIAGTVINAAGVPITPGGLTLMPSQRSASVTSVPVGARILTNGRFEFPNVPPGQYLIQANRGRSNSWTEGEFGALVVGVDGTDQTDLVLQTSAGSSIAGRVSFDTFKNAKTPATKDIQLTPIPVDPDASPTGNFATGHISEDGRFELAGISGPRRLQLTRMPAGWALEAIRVNGIDVIDRPLPFGRADQSLTDVEVVLTDRISTLRGTINDDRGRPVAGATLLVFSRDRDRWYPGSRFIRKTSTAPDGTYVLEGVPFGTYDAVGVRQIAEDGEEAWQDPAFLESLIPYSTTVLLAEGEDRVLNVRVPPP